MIKIYGTMLCKDCVAVKELYQEKGIDFEFCDFGDKIENLKEFLKLRDTTPIFEQVKAEGLVGIPCIIREDGGITLDPEAAIHR